jgi:hypothetical protein
MSSINLKFFIGNDMLLRLKGLHNSKTGAYINDADVNVVLKDLDGVEVIETGVMNYQTDTDGNYEVVWPSNTAVTLFGQYKAFITALGSGLDGDWRPIVTAEERERA